jgi:D-3-phosphoglycerate dehydrogenase
MKKVLIATRLLPEGLTEIKKHFELIMPEKDLFSREEIKQLLPHCEALLPTFSIKVDKEIIDAGTNLKIIANYGVGYNNIDIDYARSKGIAVTNTPYPVTEPTAEMAFALLLAVARRISECDRKLRIPNELEWGLLKNLGVAVYGKKIGIVGLGRIGKAIARRAIASGMEVVYFNRNRICPEEEIELQVQYRPFDELLKTSDFISISTPLTDETNHLIDSPQFDLMKQHAVLINTARGAIINEKALVKALRSGKLWGAGLDVYEFEPKITEELLLMDNVVLAPHNGTATIEARNAITEYACHCIIEFFKGNSISVVN